MLLSLMHAANDGRQIMQALGCRLGYLGLLASGQLAKTLHDAFVVHDSCGQILVRAAVL